MPIATKISKIQPDSALAAVLIQVE